MFFEKEYLSFYIIDVVKLEQKDVNLSMSARNFDAISYRFSSNAVLKTDTQTVEAADGSVIFTPARLDYTRQASYDTLIAVHINTFNYFSAELEHFTTTNSKYFESKFEELYTCWSSKHKAHKYKCAAILNEILAECYSENTNTDLSYGQINNSVKYLNEHFTNPKLTVTEIASQSYMSDVYFRKIFKNYFGISPAKYIIKRRIQYAIGLMGMGYYTLQEIATMSGYTDYSYFSSEFKRLNGIPPSEYLYNFI